MFPVTDTIVDDFVATGSARSGDVQHAAAVAVLALRKYRRSIAAQLSSGKITATPAALLHHTLSTANGTTPRFPPLD
jgi:hypothetical protein